jgi:hypothetical protein
MRELKPDCLGRVLSICFICIFWLRELDLNQRPSGYEPKPQRFQLVIDFSDLSTKPLISSIFHSDIDRHSPSLTGADRAKMAYAG